MLLPIKHNKLTLQCRGPYVVKAVINRMDYKVEVNANTKIYHANLLKQYIIRDEDTADVAVHVDSYMAVWGRAGCHQLSEVAAISWQRRLLSSAPVRT